MATLMHTDGSKQEIEDIHLLSYRQLRKLLDGPVEYVYFGASGRSSVDLVS